MMDDASNPGTQTDTFNVGATAFAIKSIGANQSPNAVAYRGTVYIIPTV